MDHSELDALISELEGMLPSSFNLLSQAPHWSSVFAKAREIQQAFNSKVQYPTRSLREAAWQRFNAARSQAFEKANEDRTRSQRESEKCRDEIMDILKHAEYHPAMEFAAMVVTGFVLTPVIKSTAEDIKAKGRDVKAAGQRLSEYKHKMLKEHKSECFERIMECRRSHDAFWGSYKQEVEERWREARARRSQIAERIDCNISANQEKLSKASAAYERVESNIRSNREKLDKAAEAYAKVLANVENNRERLASARSAEYASRVSDWISEGEDKLRDISDSIDRIRSWISEGQDRLNDIAGSIRRIEGWIEEDRRRSNDIHRRL